jgi:hypothetical protein
MSYITLDKNGLRDLIVQDELLPGMKLDLRKSVEENPLLVYKQFSTFNGINAMRRILSSSRQMEFQSV